jgi:hypothetical protein
VRQAVQQSGRHPLAVEDLAPVAEGQVTGDQQASPLVALGEHLKQEFSSRAVEGQVPQLVAGQQIGLVQLAEKPILLVLLLGLFQAVEQLRGLKEPDPAALAAGRIRSLLFSRDLVTRKTVCLPVPWFPLMTSPGDQQKKMPG